MAGNVFVRAVVAGEQDERVLVEAVFFQAIEKAADDMVHVGDHVAEGDGLLV